MQTLGEAIIFEARHRAIRMEHTPPADTRVSSIDSSVVFEQAFKEHFKRLHSYAATLLKDEDEAEEVVQNVFYKLWERREQIHTLQSVPAYLYRSVYNESLNVLRHEKVKDGYRTYAKGTGIDMQPADDTASMRELEMKLGEAMADLPEQCRTIFQMSRFEELKYREIAERLGLSVKTIENQMTKALKILRNKLVDYLPTIWLLLITLKNLLA